MYLLHLNLIQRLGYIILIAKEIALMLLRLRGRTLSTSAFRKATGLLPAGRRGARLRGSPARAFASLRAPAVRLICLPSVFYLVMCDLTFASTLLGDWFAEESLFLPRLEV